jgi:hypothetical protein
MSQSDAHANAPPSLQTAASVLGADELNGRGDSIIMHLLSHVARPCPGTGLCATCCFW